MSKVTVKRLMNEIKNIQKNNTFHVESINDDIYHLRAVIDGPPSTPYAKGHFKMDITITSRYPFVPPKVKCLTRIWHPNIYAETGEICVDILKKNWEATMNIQSVLVSIQLLLQEPNPKDGLDAFAARQYMNEKPLFMRTAQYWTAVFATEDSAEARKHFPDFEAALDKTKKAIGPRASEEVIIYALSLASWNTEDALRYLRS